MNRDDALSQQSAKQVEIERLAAFPSANYATRPATHRETPTGVLLSDEIEYYCENYKLVDPYKPENIMAASYELRVGDQYAIGTKIHRLSSGKVLEFPKFDVVIVEILETVNMPEFLIGRWNIRTRWAYEGLIWVGGPQVNPGYRGRLMCPLWNLSNHPISIPWGEAIAVMDFVITTPPTEKSNRRPLWNERSRYLFEDYIAQNLRSGLVTDAVDKIDALEKETGKEFQRNRDRMDNFNSIMFTALGVLVAAIAMFATKPSDPNGGPQYWWDPTVFWLCWVTATLSLFAWLRFSTNGIWGKLIRGFVVLLALGSIALQLFHEQRQSYREKNSIQELQNEVKALNGANAILSERVSHLSPQASGNAKQ